MTSGGPDKEASFCRPRGPCRPRCGWGYPRWFRGASGVFWGRSAVKQNGGGVAPGGQGARAPIRALRWLPGLRRFQFVLGPPGSLPTTKSPSGTSFRVRPSPPGWFPRKTPRAEFRVTLGSGRRKQALLTSTTLVSVHFTRLPPTLPASPPLPPHLGPGRGPARSRRCLGSRPPSRLPPCLPRFPVKPGRGRTEGERTTHRRGRRGHFFPVSDHREKQVEQMTGGEKNTKASELSAGERTFPRASWGWTVGGRGEGALGRGVLSSRPPTVQVPGRRLRAPGSNPTPLRGKNGRRPAAHNGFAPVLWAAAPPGLAFSAWYGPKSLAAQPAPRAGFGGPHRQQNKQRCLMLQPKLPGNKCGNRQSSERDGGAERGAAAAGRGKGGQRVDE